MRSGSERSGWGVDRGSAGRARDRHPREQVQGSRGPGVRGRRQIARAVALARQSEIGAADDLAEADCPAPQFYGDDSGAGSRWASGEAAKKAATARAQGPAAQLLGCLRLASQEGGRRERPLPLSPGQQVRLGVAGRGYRFEPMLGAAQRTRKRLLQMDLSVKGPPRGLSDQP